MTSKQSVITADIEANFLISVQSVEVQILSTDTAKILQYLCLKIT